MIVIKEKASKGGGGQREVLEGGDGVKKQTTLPE